MSESRSNLIPGTLNVLILKALSWGPLHGYAISKWIQHATDQVLRVEEGVLYPALHRLERDGLLEAEWGVNDTGRRARFYSLTPAGKKHLKAEVARWKRSSAAVSGLLDAAEA
jgi:PadR family transcriptional regulator PadR